MDSPFPAAADPFCEHRSHYECVKCRKIVCARCGAEMAMASDNWKPMKPIGYWCDSCLAQKIEMA